MATVASVSTANPGNASSITVTKPSGLAAGDLMILHYTFNDATDTAGTISGWTHEVDNYGGTQKTGIQYKVADSSDASASDFTLTFSGTVGTPIAAILRITDFVNASLLNENKDTGANGDTTLAMGVTPLYTNNLLLFFVANNENAAIGNYAIATSNPTWTEQYDVQSGSVSGLACASATRTQTTATGDASFSESVGSGTVDFYGILMAIETPASVSVNGSTGTMTFTGNSGTVSGSAVVTGSTGTMTFTGNSGTVSTPTPDWDTVDKTGSASWTNTAKS